MKIILLTVGLLISPSLYAMEKDYTAKVSVMIKARAAQALKCYQELQQHEDLFTPDFDTAQLAELAIKNHRIVTAIASYAFELRKSLRPIIKPPNPSGRPVYVISEGYSMNSRPILRRLKTDASICSMTSDRVRLQLVNIWTQNQDQGPKSPSECARMLGKTDLNCFKFNFLALLENKEESLQLLKNLVEKPISIQQVGAPVPS